MHKNVLFLLKHLKTAKRWDWSTKPPSRDSRLGVPPSDLKPLH